MGTGSCRKWVKGPWNFSGKNLSGGLNITTEVEGKVLFVAWAAYSVGHESEQIASARLIAAAPDLYEALVELLKHFAGHYGGLDVDEETLAKYPLIGVRAFVTAQKALAKACGESGEPDLKPVRSAVEPQDVK